MHRVQKSGLPVSEALFFAEYKSAACQHARSSSYYIIWGAGRFL